MWVFVNARTVVFFYTVNWVPMVLFRVYEHKWLLPLCVHDHTVGTGVSRVARESALRIEMHETENIETNEQHARKVTNDVMLQRVRKERRVL